MPASGAIRIRPFAPTERPQWNALWRGYLAFYGAVLDETVHAATWSRLNDPDEPMHALAAERDGVAVGLVHFLYHRSTWTIGPYCYLQDLFVADAARGLGAGRALIEAVYERAERDGASWVHWLTMEDNAAARALYDRLADRPGFIQYRRVF